MIYVILKIPLIEGVMFLALQKTERPKIYRTIPKRPVVYSFSIYYNIRIPTSVNYGNMLRPTVVAKKATHPYHTGKYVTTFLQIWKHLMILRWKFSRVETPQTPKIKLKIYWELTFANGSLKKCRGHNTTFREQKL